MKNEKFCSTYVKRASFKALATRFQARRLDHTRAYLTGKMLLTVPTKGDK